MDFINSLLKRAWWRLVLIDLIRSLAVTLTIATSALIVWRLLQSVAPVPATWGVLAGVAGGVAFVWAVVWSVVRTKKGGPERNALDCAVCQRRTRRVVTRDG